jgi:putative ABC transport system permease protein
MPLRDLGQLAWGSLCSKPQRAVLTALGLIIGIAAVVLLTAIGSGVHRFVLTQFSQFGTHLISVRPGKTTTFGVSGASISTVRPLSQADAASLTHIEAAQAVMPLLQGNARIESDNKQRRASVLGVGSALPSVWQMALANGQFLPADSDDNPRAFAVLGSTLAQALFDSGKPLGQRIRVGNDRFRVIGVMQPKGQLLGQDLDDAVFIPSIKAMELFNRQSLMEIIIRYDSQAEVSAVEQAIKNLLIARHGTEDFTVITQNQMLDKMDAVLRILTLAVAAMGSISLVVGAVGIFTLMTIAVSERISEIGLLRALGAERSMIFGVFIAEALLLSSAGGVLGVAVGISLVLALQLLLPALPLQLAWDYIAMAFGLSVAMGSLSGVAPAIKAARLHPLQALRTE